MKLLLTGGTGFLGYHIANQLADRGVSTILYDLAAPDPADYPDTATAVQGDVRDFARLHRRMMDDAPDAVVHAAAALPLWAKDDIRTVGIDGTRNVLEAARQAGVPRVVHISSTAVYGIPKTHPLREDNPVVGVGAYGEAKIAAEQICEAMRAEGLIVPVLRPKTFIGTGRLGVFQILYDWIERGCRIPIIGSGANRYQLLEVSDLVEAVWLCLTAPADDVNTTFNVGAKEFGTVKDDVGALCEYSGTGASVLPTNALVVKSLLRILEALGLSPLYKWVYGTADTDSFVSVEKIEQTLGWRSQYSNAEALIRSYQWYRDHKDKAQGSSGVTHRTPWKQGALRIARWLLQNRHSLPATP